MTLFYDCLLNLWWVSWAILNMAFVYVEMPFGHEKKSVGRLTLFFGIISIPVLIWNSLWLVKTFFQIP